MIELKNRIVNCSLGYVFHLEFFSGGLPKYNLDQSQIDDDDDHLPSLVGLLAYILANE